MSDKMEAILSGCDSRFGDRFGYVGIKGYL